MENKMQITEVTIDDKDLFNGAKVRGKHSGKVREIFVLPEGMRISEAVDKKLFNMETQVEYETVMMNKHLFELIDATSEDNKSSIQEWKIEHIEEGRCWVTENGEPVLKICDSPNEYQIAQRVVKSVNMQDGFIAMLKRNHETLLSVYSGGNFGEQNLVTQQILRDEMKDILGLIKQAEEK